MQLEQENETQLVLKQSGLSNMLYGLLFVGMGTIVVIAANQNVLIARLFGGLCVIVGILVVVTSKFITIIIDKAQNQLEYLTNNLLGKKINTVDLKQIKEVSLEEFVSDSSGARGRSTRISYYLVFNLQDGEGISILMGGDSGGITVNGVPLGGFKAGRNQNVVLANKIASFIGVPFIDRRSPPTFPTLPNQTPS